MSRICLLLALTVTFVIGTTFAVSDSDSEIGRVQCANLVYAKNKSSVCYSPEFLKEIGKKTNITTNETFTSVRLDSAELYMHPFAVMTGEGSFRLTEDDRENLREYMTGGGFLVASAGCSSRDWSDSFKREIAKVFPDVELKKLELDHPIFHTVYDIDRLKLKRGSRQHLEGIEIDGKIVCVFSSDGLNDTGKAGGNCCCCGGDEIKNAREVNVNLLVYALTH
jgi:hypothetical protein